MNDVTVANSIPIKIKNNAALRRRKHIKEENANSSISKRKSFAVCYSFQSLAALRAVSLFDVITVRSLYFYITQ